MSEVISESVSVLRGSHLATNRLDNLRSNQQLHYYAG
jgi:hypothetical protein